MSMGPSGSGTPSPVMTIEDFHSCQSMLLVVLFGFFLFILAVLAVMFLPDDVWKNLLGIGFGIIFYGSIIAGIVTVVKHNRRR